MAKIIIIFELGKKILKKNTCKLLFSDCPFEREDVRSRFWWGESMFAGLDTEKTFKGYAADVVEWRKWLKEHKPNQAARFLRENTDRQLAVALYIVLLYGQWCPYDSDEFIFDY